MKKNFLFLAVVLFIASCARVTYTPEAERAARKHNIIAVLMPKVILPVDKKITADDKAKMEVAESEQFQTEIVSWLMKRKSQNKINVDIMDAATAAAKLANLPKDKVYTPNEMAEALGVDAVITSQFKLSKPMSTGAAIATSILFGFGTTNQANVNMQLHDKALNKVIMDFAHTVSGGLLNSRESLTNEVMRIASKKLPYTKFEIK
jgi:hypothetical protein